MVTRQRRKWKRACFCSILSIILVFSMRPYLTVNNVPLASEPTVTRQKLTGALNTGFQSDRSKAVRLPLSSHDVEQLQSMDHFKQSTNTWGHKKPNYYVQQNFLKNHRRVRRNIFMLETSGKSSLTPRQACAVESAARENLNLDVFLYMTTSRINLTDEYMSALASIPNLKFVHLDLNKLFTGTRLESWYLDSKWHTSLYNISHLSDAVRFLTLHEKGGIYMDLDVVVLKPVHDLQNCAGLEDDDWVAAGVMAFDKGHFFTKLCLEEFAENYDGSRWGYNGPELVTRVLKRLCGGLTDLRTVSRDRCHGVTVLPPEAFYAIPWQRWHDFFDEEEPHKVIQQWKDSYLIHVWNTFSSTTKVIIGSYQPYEIAASKYCPSTYKLTVKAGSF